MKPKSTTTKKTKSREHKLYVKLEFKDRRTLVAANLPTKRTLAVIGAALTTIIGFFIQLITQLPSR